MAEFYVQEKPADYWHVETEDDCEEMLCGKRISVDLGSSKVQSTWGPRRCPDCWIALEKLRKVRAMRRG